MKFHVIHYFYADFPDCLQIPSVCNPTQICRDTPPGSFTCSCPPGTSLNENGTCVIIDGMCPYCTVEDTKKLTFRNSRTIVLRFHWLLITVAIVF